MRRKTSVVAVVACALMASSAWAGPAGMSLSKAVGVDSEAAIYDFQQANPHANLLKSGERIIQVYGRAFGYGDSPEEVAEAFRLDYAEMFGVQADELDSRGPLFDERHTQGVMYNRETGEYKFTLVYYTQYESGIPVFRADLRLLVRNEPGHALVLAASALRDLGTFSVNRVRPTDFDVAKQSAIQAVPDLINFTEPRRVIWAGVDDQVVEPAVGIEFVADNGREATGDYAKWLFVTDVKTGDILYQENQVLNIDVFGNVSGNASQDVGADFCVPEAVEPMPYARVDIVGGNSAFANENGDFVILNGGDTEVTVRSPVRGEFFNVFNQGGPDTVLSQDVVPPGPADFIHNEANNQEFIRAEVNGYVEANVVRDAILVAHPTYPGISTDREFRVNVNINSSCNAFYDGNSINFYREGGGCSNTANTDVVHHEYGHHLVARGGSGQGQYGEGMGDVLGVVLTDQSITGLGFFLGNCVSGIRDADNNKQYPCTGGIHDCGQLLSGCVWDTRNELMITEPDTYTEMLFSLAVNSVLVHIGSGIGPDITEAWLTLDDDDGDIGNGTPHRAEICAGFGAHSMDCPPLNLLAFTYPEGRPDFVPPLAPTVFPVDIQSVTGELDETSPMQHVSIDGGPFESTPLDPLLGAGVLYNVVLPGANCFSTMDWYLSALTTDKVEVVDPSGAPSETYKTDVGDGPPGEVIFEEDFENPVGYTVSGDANTGQWELAVPTSCNRGDPPSDFDGSGKCYVTEDQRPPSCDNDVDGGSTILTSPAFDMTGNGDPYISYARWYSNDQGSTPETDIFVVDISNDGGNTWVNLETVGPSGPEVRGGWFVKTFRVADFVEPTNEVRLRWNASDLGQGSVVEAAIDALKLEMLQCDDESILLLPIDFEVIRGILNSGVVEDLFESDDAKVFVQPDVFLPDAEPPVKVEVTGTSPEPSPSELRFRLESSASRGMIKQRISLFNYVSQSYEELDFRTTPTSDGVVDIVVSDDPSRFINQKTGEMKALLTWRAAGLSFFSGWEIGIDQAIWRYLP